MSFKQINEWINNPDFQKKIIDVKSSSVKSQNKKRNRKSKRKIVSSKSKAKIRPMSNYAKKKLKQYKANKLCFRGLIPIAGSNRTFRHTADVLSLKGKEADLFVECCHEMVTLFNHLVKHRGLGQGAKRFREIRNYLIKWIYGLQVDPIPCLGLQKDKFPSDCRMLKPFCDPEKIQIVYTIMSVSRLSQDLSGKIHLDSVTKGIARSKDFWKEIDGFDKFSRKFFRELNWKFDPRDLGKNVKFHYSERSGPNSPKGGDAIYSSHLDAFALMNDRILSKYVKNLCHMYNKDDLFTYIDALSKSVDSCISDKKNLKHSRLTAVRQPESKDRIVAIIDYFSQMLLLPLHNHLNGLCKEVGNNYAHDQDRGCELVRKFTTFKTKLPQSLDGTNFTDRFPKELQKVVLSNMFNKEYADNIIGLMTNRTFSVKDRVPVKYEVGQPMGAFASFPLMNLTHSLYVIWKCHINDINPYTHTAVVGDDIAFGHNSMAYQAYYDGMISLGIEFSHNKGFHCKSIKDRKIAEFCKRLFVDGMVIKPVSPRVTSKTARDFRYISCLSEYISRDQLVGLASSTKEAYRDSALFALYVPKSISGISTSYDVVDPNISFGDFNKHLMSIKDHVNENLLYRKIFLDVIVSHIFDNLSAKKNHLRSFVNAFFKVNNLESIMNTIKSYDEWIASHELFPIVPKLSTLGLSSFVAVSDQNPSLKLLSLEVPHPLVIVYAGILDFETKSSELMADISKIKSKRLVEASKGFSTIIDAISLERFDEFSRNIKKLTRSRPSESDLDITIHRDSKFRERKAHLMMFLVLQLKKTIENLTIENDMITYQVPKLNFPTSVSLRDFQ